LDQQRKRKKEKEKEKEKGWCIEQQGVEELQWLGFMIVGRDQAVLARGGPRDHWSSMTTLVMAIAEDYHHITDHQR
jgi:hypothetical protein